MPTNLLLMTLVTVEGLAIPLAMMTILMLVALAMNSENIHLPMMTRIESTHVVLEVSEAEVIVPVWMNPTEDLSSTTDETQATIFTVVRMETSTWTKPTTNGPTRRATEFATAMLTAMKVTVLQVQALRSGLFLRRLQGVVGFRLCNRPNKRTEACRRCRAGVPHFRPHLLTMVRRAGP